MAEGAFVVLGDCPKTITLSGLVTTPFEAIWPLLFLNKVTKDEIMNISRGDKLDIGD